MKLKNSYLMAFSALMLSTNASLAAPFTCKGTGPLDEKQAENCITNQRFCRIY
jgi:hypothetical protein